MVGKVFLQSLKLDSFYLLENYSFGFSFSFFQPLMIENTESLFAILGFEL